VVKQVEVGSGLSAYVRLLAHGPASRPFLAAVVARLPIAMAPIGMILLIQHIRGAYGIAGFVTGAYALGTAAGSPFWGRMMDRLGQPRVLIPTSLASASVLAGLAIAAVAGAPDPVLIVLAAVSGLAFPPISPAMRAAWRVIFPDAESRRVGYALDATSVEFVFVSGPLLLSLLLAFTPPVVPLLVTAALMAGGGLAFSSTSAARTWTPESRTSVAGDVHHGRKSAITAPGVASVLAVMTVMSIGFGQLDTSMAATAGEVLGGTQRVGILFASIAGGSAIGGLLYGARHWGGDERRRVSTFLGVFAFFLACMSVLMLTDSRPLWLMLPLLFLTGLTIAPTLIMQQNLLDTLAPPNRVNEAQSFLTASNTSGAAAGTALAGILIDYHGLSWSFAGAAIAVAIAASIAFGSQRIWHAAIERNRPRVDVPVC
jgi:MFS family permease